jgi:hypothetical protein
LKLHITDSGDRLSDHINIEIQPAGPTCDVAPGGFGQVGIDNLRFSANSIEQIRISRVSDFFDLDKFLELAALCHNWLEIGGSLSIASPVRLIRAGGEIYISLQKLLKGGSFRNRHHSSLINILTKMGYEDVIKDNSSPFDRSGVTVRGFKKTEQSLETLGSSKQKCIDDSIISEQKLVDNSRNQFAKLNEKLDEYAKLFASAGGENLFGQAEKFMILFSGRSGGTLLSRSLGNHPNIFCQPESLHYMRWPEQVEIMRKLYALDSSVIGAVGLITKLIAFDPEVYNELTDFINANGIKVIHLYRSNPVEHGFSTYNGMLLFNKNGHFEVYDDSERITPYEVELDQFFDEMFFKIEMERRLFCFADGVKDKVSVCFEDFIGDKQGTLNRLQRWLGVPVNENIIEPMKKVVSEPLNRSISNYSQFCDMIENLMVDYNVVRAKGVRPFGHYLPD